MKKWKWGKFIREIGEIMKYQNKPHKKTEDKKSFITKMREKEQKEMDRLKKTLNKNNEDNSEKVDNNT